MTAAGARTFVSDLAERRKPKLVGEDDAEWIDLTINRPPSEGCSQDFGETLRKLSKRPDLADLLGHQPSKGHSKHRAAGAEWISRVGPSASPEQVIVCNGVQHGLAVAFAALSRPGDLILTEDLNYPGIKLLEKIYHLRLRGLAMDEDGLCPESLEEACKRDKAKFLLCTPTVHNPTASVVPLKRRERIAELAAKYDLVIIENDIHGFLPAEPMPPISTLVPERSYYINGTSKCIGAGVRIGYIVAPHSAVDEIATAVQATTWMASPLAAEIVSLWFNDGTADKIIQWHRREASARQKIAKQVLSDFDYTYHSVGYHIWLSLPEPWRREDFVKQTVKRHVLVTPAEAFVIGRAVAPHAVHVSLGGPPTGLVSNEG